jgi:hypothetical protein
MSAQALYPISGLIILIGVGALFYGASTASLTVILEGLFLLWTGFKITVSVWEGNRLDM